jgi:hypothetical protein
MTEGIAEIKQFQSPRKNDEVYPKTMPETRHTFYNCIFFKFNIQCESAIIETGLRRDVQPGEVHNLQGCTELQKSINYLTFSGTTSSSNHC